MYLIYLQDNEASLPQHIFVINDYLTAINALYGPLLALIFYTKTLEARRAWISNFRRLYHFITNSRTNEDEDKGEGEERCGSIISVDDIEITTTTSSTTSINPISKDITRIDEL